MKKFPSAAVLLFFSLLILTPARLSAAEPFFFIQLSDPQLGMFTENKDFTQDAANFEFASAEMANVPSMIAVMIMKAAVRQPPADDRDAIALRPKARNCMTTPPQWPFERPLTQHTRTG